MSNGSRPDAEILQVLINELNNLREELHNLKNCQFLFLRLAVTCTGTILAALLVFIGKGERAPWYISFAFLSPLLIIIPCWLIFLDKATTISRIVGYYRLLEKIIILTVNQRETYIVNSLRYMGWENSLKEFRKRSTDKGTLVRYRYWVLTYYTFFLLVVFCILGFIFYTAFSLEVPIFGITLSGFKLFIFLSILGIIICIAFHEWTRRSLLRELYDGKKYSYSENEKNWLKILDP